MALKINRLNAKQAESIGTPGRHADGQNLFLSVSESGRRRWVFLYRWQGGRVELGLGSARDISLAAARELARQARELLRQGVDPRSVRQAPTEEPKMAPSLPTFGDVSDDLIATMEHGWKNEKHIAQWRMTMQVYAAPLREMIIGDVGTEDVLRVLQPIWTKKPETASRIRGRIERVLAAAKAKGLRTGENPAQWRGHLDQLLPRPKKLNRGHFAALPYDQLPTFMGELRAREAKAARALEFLILTAARSSEARGARVGEIDLDKRLWLVPAQRMKAARGHRVPLTPRAIEIARRAMAGKRRDDLLFAGQKSGMPFAETAFRMLFDRMGFVGITTHGFRSTFKDWAAECTSFPNELSEMALAHVVSNQTEAAYRRGDMLERRRMLMEAWEKYGAPSSSVRL